MIYNIEIELLSPLQLGSGLADVVTDSDSVHDKYGMPYFPGKRLKGLLYESALEMAEISGGTWFTEEDADRLFGHGGQESSSLRVDNFMLPDYEKLCLGWEHLQKNYPEIFSGKRIWDSYTELRYQTSIDDETGTTEDGSLRNMRVVDAGLKFTGRIYLYDGSELNRSILEKALANLRYAGAKRNRGFGRIKCTVKNSGQGK